MASKTQNAITLKGSTEIVADFFHYGLNSILYQRGIYHSESFSPVQKWGLTMLVTADEKLQAFLAEILSQVKNWLSDLTLEKLVLVIKSVASDEVLERWQFDIQCDKSMTADEKREGDLKSIQDEIRAIIRQITASVSFLPLLDTECRFDILVYTNKGCEVPDAWGETGPHLIYNSEEVRFKSFSTTVHKVNASVAYKVSD